MIAQRLVRRLCPHCREAGAVDPARGARCSASSRARWSIEPVGCKQCGETGFKGRIGVFEAVRIDDTIRRMINEAADEAMHRRHAFGKTADGNRCGQRLARAARRLVLAGVTTAEEAVARVAPRGRAALMAKYAYLAVDPQGRERRGAVDAAIDRRRARAAGEAPLARRCALTKRWPARPRSKPGGLALPLLGSKLTTKQLSLFTRQLPR